MENLLLFLPVLILSIVLHEVAHGWVARQQGDPTAAMLGRLTLNPIPHIDPIGSLLLPAILAITNAPFLFGWAKPVPVNPRNFKNFKRGDILVSLAGVFVNFLLAIAFTLLLALAQWGIRLAPGLSETWLIVGAMAIQGIRINLVLMLFNLIPIPPLDGSHVFAYLLPPKLALRYRQIGMAGTAIIFVLLFLTGFRFLAVPIFWLENVAIAIVSILV